MSAQDDNMLTSSWKASKLYKDSKNKRSSTMFGEKLRVFSYFFFRNSSRFKIKCYICAECEDMLCCLCRKC